MDGGEGARSRSMLQSSHGGRRPRQEAAAFESVISASNSSSSFVAGPFTVAREHAGGREVSMYLLSASPAAARDQARTLSRAITAMESRFGPYPYASYGVAEVPESSATWAASSEQGVIMARSSMFHASGGNLPLFAHEAAHSWWGNSVSTTGPGSKMGSEALAQYGAVLAIEALEGKLEKSSGMRGNLVLGETQSHREDCHPGRSEGSPNPAFAP
jgi:hypothetical protein